jgi:hypothetical protein
MVSRREILQGGIAVTSLPLVAGMAWAPLLSSTTGASAQASTRPLEHLSLYKVLFDQRFAAARSFGRQAQWRGESVHGFDGDITNIWYHDLHPRWQQGPAAIAGLTAHGALFCLERLAWDVSMRVTYRAEQTYDGHEPLYAWVIAPRARIGRSS